MDILQGRGLYFPFPTGIESVDNDYGLNGVVKKSSYVGLIAPGGVGKTSFIFQTAVIEPYFHALENNKKLSIDYFSFEMSKKVLITRAVIYLLAKKYKKVTYQFNGKTHRIDMPYILGDIPKDSNRKEPIPIDIKTIEQIREIEKKYLVPMFGTFDKNWNQITKGKITIYVDPDTADGIYYTILNKARESGEIMLKKRKTIVNGVEKEVQFIDNYVPNNKEETKVIIVDHFRLLRLKKGETRKASMDKLSKLFVRLRDIFHFCLIGIGHTNRNKFDTNTFKFSGDTLLFDGSDQKDSGCFDEDCDNLITMFNPNDPVFKLDSYFGFPLSEFKKLIGVHWTKVRTGGNKSKMVEFDGASGIFYTPPNLHKFLK